MDLVHLRGPAGSQYGAVRTTRRARLRRPLVHICQAVPPGPMTTTTSAIRMAAVELRVSWRCSSTSLPGALARAPSPRLIEDWQDATLTGAVAARVQVAATLGVGGRCCLGGLAGSSIGVSRIGGSPCAPRLRFSPTGSSGLGLGFRSSGWKQGHGTVCAGYVNNGAPGVRARAVEEPEPGLRRAVGV